MRNYFDTIQEFFSLEPTERIRSRQLRAQISDIERLLKLEGFWIMGGIASYEAILEDQERNEDAEEFEDGYGEDEDGYGEDEDRFDERARWNDT